MLLTKFGKRVFRTRHRQAISIMGGAARDTNEYEASRVRGGGRWKVRWADDGGQEGIVEPRQRARVSDKTGDGRTGRGKR